MLERLEESKGMVTEFKGTGEKREIIPQNESGATFLAEEDKELTAYDVKLKYGYEYMLKEMYAPENCQIGNNSFQFDTVEGRTCGVITKDSFHANQIIDKGELYVTFDCKINGGMQSTEESPFIRVCLFYQKDVENSQEKANVIEPVENCKQGFNAVSIDLAYYQQYKGLKDTFQILFVANKTYGTNQVEANNIEIFQDSVYEYHYGDNVMDALKCLTKEIDSLKNGTPEIDNKVEYIAPDGTKCILQVSNDYTVHAVPVVSE